MSSCSARRRTARVLYTSFAACALGLTVVVPEDAISSRTAIATQTARWQLLNQPGFMNERNTALRPQAVTLSQTDLISFASPA
jgi:nicotinamidase-related amidase